MMGARVLWAGGLAGLGLLLGAQAGLAQIVPDGTLGVESSRVQSVDAATLRLEGGAARGVNLFHSFQEFNAGDGQRVYFANPTGIEAILGRVTGNNLSNIQGTLGVDGGASLFLLNPNGFVFGPNATLDIRGSFLASTGSGFTFADGSEFSASNPQAPPLLTVNVSPGLQNGTIRQGAMIISQGNLETINDITLMADGIELQGSLQANGGDITLHGFGDIETQSLLTKGGEISVISSTGKFTNRERIDTSNAERSGGSILITAYKDVAIGDIKSSSASSTTPVSGGKIRIATTNGSIVTGNIDSSSSRLVVAGQPATIDDASNGDGGTIILTTIEGNILTGNLESRSAAFINPGSGGIIKLTTIGGSIATKNVDSSSIGVDNNQNDGGAVAFSSVDGDITILGYVSTASIAVLGNSGNGGTINLSSIKGDVFILEGLQSISESILGSSSNGGAINISTIGGNIYTIGNLSSFSVSGVFGDQLASKVTSGNGGEISLSTIGGSIFAQGSFLSFSLVSGKTGDLGTSGNGGEISLAAENRAIIGGPFVTLQSFSVAENGKSGNGGNILLKAKDAITDLEILTLSSSANAGTVQIEGFGDLLITNARFLTTKQLALTNPIITPPRTIQLTVGTTGRSGDVFIASSGNLALVDTEIQSDTKGRDSAGNVTIASPSSITFSNSQIISNTSSAGQAGNITVNAGQGIEITGANSGLFAQTTNAGPAGNITLNTPQLTLQQNAQISTTATATSTNRDRGGSITLNASNLNLAGIVGVFAETQGQTPAGTLTLAPYADQSSLNLHLTPQAKISASTSGSGNGGDLVITAPQAITISGPGSLAVETTGTGTAGNITLTTQDLTLTDGVQISASTQSSGAAGGIQINANRLTMDHGAQVLSNTSSSGDAGNLTLNLRDQLTLNGEGTGLFATTTPGSTGQGGNITIDPNRVLVQDRATIAVGSEGQGQGGNIRIRSGQLDLSNQGSITAETASSQGGNITLNLDQALVMRNGSLISATAGRAQGAGDGGNITITAPFVLTRPGENNDIIANAFSGTGGNITITADSILNFTVNDKKDFDTLRAQPTNDISASSQLGTQGVLNLVGLNVDPSQGAFEFPGVFNPPDRIRDLCKADGNRPGRAYTDKFVITGRGGMAETPFDTVRSLPSDPPPWITLTPRDDTAAQRTPDQRTPDQRHSLSQSPPPLKEATTWQQRPDGVVELVAEEAIVVGTKRPCDLERLEQLSGSLPGSKPTPMGDEPQRKTSSLGHN